MSDANIEVVTDGGWMTIWLNRPQSRNALSAAMISELADLLSRTADDASVRGITMRGRGSVFCAGGDLKGFGQDLSNDTSARAAIESSSQSAGHLFHQVDQMPQVVVMLVHGAAIAGGLGLMCAGDVVATTADARFSLTETQLGIVPAQIAPLVTRRIGAAPARRIMLTGAQFDGTTAHSLGLCDFAVDDSNGLDAIEATVRRDVLRCAPGAIAATKALLRDSRHMPQSDIVEHAAQVFAERLLSDEGREGIQSFLEKRKPGWSTP
ncbi:MAG: enoyl-CoA hydratase-related protein [Pseudomonadota bacterium]